MEYVNMGRSGLKVSRVALGCGFRGMTDQDLMERIIRHAIDRGVNFIDCANTYVGGIGEQVLGRVLPGQRDELVITTKVTSIVGQGPNDIGSSRYHIMREIDRSLRRLQTDHVDIYIVHWRDQTTPLEETVRAMTDVVASGKTRYWGVSSYQAWEACQALWLADRAVAPGFITTQNQYSLLCRDPEQELFPFCREFGIGVMAFSPLAVGVLSGDLQQGQPAPAGTLWERQPPYELESVLTDRAQRVIDVLREIGAAHGRNPTAVAIRWVISRPEVATAIAGPDTTEQLDAYIDAAGWELTADEIARLDEASDPAG